MVRLLPVANIVALTGVSTFLLRPSMRMLSFSWVRAWQRNELSRRCSQLSSEITTSPASSAAPSRFSSSSSVLPCDMTGMSWPIASVATMSTSSDLPVPAVGDVKACRGAVAMARRSSAVRMAESATVRSASATKGNVAISCSSVASAASASSLLGSRGTGGKLSLSGLNSSPLAGSYPGCSHSEPSVRRNGVCTMPDRIGSFHAPCRAR